MVRAKNGLSVSGELWMVDDETIKYLDYVEGVPNFYDRQSITLDDGQIVQSYLFQLETAGLADIGPEW